MGMGVNVESCSARGCASKPLSDMVKTNHDLIYITPTMRNHGKWAGLDELTCGNQSPEHSSIQQVQSATPSMRPVS